VDFDRLFTISAFEGLRLLRNLIATVPAVKPEDCPSALLGYAPEASSYDLDAAMQLHSMVAVDAPHDTVAFYRECVLAVLLVKMPAFAKLMTLGRGRFIKRIKGDEYRDIRSVFREAKLLDPPTAEDIQWWDTILGRVRLNFDQERLALARAAESLSLEYERSELRKLGIAEEPIWMALEDNTVGYDVLSHRLAEGGSTKNLLVEVKSTIASPLRFIVSRNEWDVADQVGASYLFHVWDMTKTPPAHYIRTVEQVRPHVPVDNQKGKWKTAQIPLGI